MPTPAEILALAWQHHQEGDLRLAEQLYRQIIQSDPINADAWCFLGASCEAQGKDEEAEASYRRAAQLAPEYVSAHNSLGILLARQGRITEAGGCFEKATSLQPDSAVAHNNLGLIRARQGEREEAIACYQRAMQLQPDYAPAQCNLELIFRAGANQKAGWSEANEPAAESVQAAHLRGVALAGEGNLDGAIAWFRRALELQPDNSDSHHNLSSALILQHRNEEAYLHCQAALRCSPNFVEAHNNLGIVLERQDQFDEAIRSFRQALQLRPAYAEAWFNLGYTFDRQGQYEDALSQYREAVRFKPDYVDAHHNWGALLGKLGRIAEAENHYREALRIQPNYVESHNNLAVLLHEQGKLREALIHFDHVADLKPDFAEARWNRSFVWLLLGDFERGWLEYEWRWHQKGFTLGDIAAPRWDGSPLDGKTILLHVEQGRGDTLQFIRYAPLLKERGANVIVACQHELINLLKGAAGVDSVASCGSNLPDVDYYAPLLSLPAILDTTLATIPANVPYLRPDAKLVEHWRGKLSKLQGLRIGIAWQGNPSYRLDRLRSIPLSQFVPLGRVEGAHLISLQKGWGLDQLDALQGKLLLTDLGGTLDASGAFMDTAAVMANVDLVITSDTAIAHLAGALGVRVWVALPLVPDWRWLLHRDDSPWYPSMRLFRQKLAGDWDDVFTRIIAEVKGIV